MFGSKNQDGSSKNTVLFGAVSLAAIILAIITSIKVTTWERHEAEYSLRASEQRVVSQEIATYSLEASSGNKQAFSQLKDSRERFERLLSEIREGDEAARLPAAPESMKPVLDDMESAWFQLSENADGILRSQDAIVSVGEFIEIINETAPEVVAQFEEIVDILVQLEVPQEQIFIASKQLMLAQRIQHSVNNVLAGGELSSQSLDQFALDSGQFNDVLNGMIEGDENLGIEKVADEEIQELLQETSALFSSVSDYAEEIIILTPELLPALDAASLVADSSDRVNEQANVTLTEFSKSPGLWHIGAFQIGATTVTALGALVLIFLALTAWSLISNANRRQRLTAEQNEKNQEAILKLLDEMGDLADGDLTVTATVTEDITGAIADSINYAIEALRSLVTTINETSVQVTASAQESRSTAMHLAEASEHQAEQITSATEAVVDMSTALEDLSSDAYESQDVAQRSVDFAGKGNEAVNDTIKGMDNIREQIQETSKRIKRLGESSQQIGEIVELIDDIADQTNILALNAAMQAAMAGEAGRGFAVVADEVQRLAERSSNATKQIETLVKTIQADTNEAVASMETSTTEVVNGAKLAEGAGDALKEIENVSNYIADITQKMANSAKLQADGATQIRTNMGVIKEITIQTREGTNQSAASIDTLAEMSDELGRSVAGFRLPE
ncbi:MAG: methyl-accepting chemotaxis protein [Gammaproteobacteria bacterium]|nr:methyl-accepting chemotaxis protein [Gammaproteobacteria bacterium]